VTALGDAEGVVRLARRRLGAALALDGALRGALAGAAAGIAVAAGVWALAASAPPSWLLAAPLAGAAGGAWLLRRRLPDLAGAALVLDRAARTDEGFVSALSARDASPEIRELAASWALGKCGRGAVSRVLPIETPRVAAAAVLATAALAAGVVLRGPGADATPRVDETPQAAVAPAAGPSASPRDRVAAAATALRAGTEPAPSLREEVRGDLASVPGNDLLALAEALAAGGSEDGRRAAEALARGDVAVAVEALRRALGGAVSAPGTALPGGAGPGPGGAPGGPAPRPRAPETWPLRYDRAVERWLASPEERR